MLLGECMKWSIEAAYYLNVIAEDADLIIYVMASVVQTKQTFVTKEKLVMDKPDLILKVSDRFLCSY